MLLSRTVLLQLLLQFLDAVLQNLDGDREISNDHLDPLLGGGDRHIALLH
jgi:hypothetical protein